MPPRGCVGPCGGAGTGRGAEGTLAKRRLDGVIAGLPGSQTFQVVADGLSSAANRVAMAEFAGKIAQLQKALTCD